MASGLVALAAVMLLLAGCLNIFRGIMAIAEDAVFVRTPNYVFKFDLTSWGWIHLALGVLAIAVGVGLFRLAIWARVLGIVVAALLVIANFLSIPYYPLWSLTVMAACGFVIWGLCVVRDDGGPPSD
jgi:nitrate reductase NapE component